MKRLIIALMIVWFSGCHCIGCDDIPGWAINNCAKFCEDKNGIDFIKYESWGDGPGIPGMTCYCNQGSTWELRSKGVNK